MDKLGNTQSQIERYEKHLRENWTPNGRKRIGNLVDVAPTKYQTFHIEQPKSFPKDFPEYVLIEANGTEVKNER